MPVAEVDLSEIHILYCLGKFQQESWRRFFDEYDIRPHSVFYENLVEKFESTVRGALDFLEIDPAQVQINGPNSVKQADALSQEWEERYHNFLAEHSS